MVNLMFHRADVWRPTLEQGPTSQDISGYSRVHSNVPCFIQPASNEMQYFYSLRGTVITHSIYTTAVDKVFKREDIFEDADGNQFHLIADPKNALMFNLYLELPAEQYPEEGKKRLSREEYS